jgi:hypothetical protein
MMSTKREMQVAIDEVTLERKRQHYAAGDYARLGEITNVTPVTIAACFKKGIAPVSIARAMKIYYEEKVKIIEELNS